jgi:hypothetical protein
MHSRCLVFFSFFPSVATMFPLSSQWVLIRFPICSQCVPQHVLHSTSLLSHVLWQLVVLGTLHLKIDPSILWSFHNFIFLSHGPIKLAHCKKEEEVELGRHLI